MLSFRSLFSLLRLSLEICLAAFTSGIGCCYWCTHGGFGTGSLRCTHRRDVYREIAPWLWLRRAPELTCLCGVSAEDTKMSFSEVTGFFQSLFFFLCHNVTRIPRVQGSSRQSYDTEGRQSLLVLQRWVGPWSMLSSWTGEKKKEWPRFSLYTFQM